MTKKFMNEQAGLYWYAYWINTETPVISKDSKNLPELHLEELATLDTDRIGSGRCW